MKVFISWSGERSRDVGVLFREWLPLVLNAVQPFVSSKDIRAGSRWQTEIASELDETDFGLICVTKGNRTAEWLNFEAGALAKAVDSSHVVPLVVDLSPAEIENPLGQFQAIRLTAEDVASLVRSMNEACPNPISDENLGKSLEKWWPDLEEGLAEIAARPYETEVREPPKRSDRDLLEELLEAVRELTRTASSSSPRRTAADALAAVLASGGITDWSASIDDSVVTVRFKDTPPPRVRRAAEAAMSPFGMKVEFSTPGRVDLGS